MSGKHQPHHGGSVFFDYDKSDLIDLLATVPFISMFDLVLKAREKILNTEW